MNYRKAQLALCTAGCVFILLLVIVAARSPRQLPRKGGTVTLSHRSGFYDSDFDLELESPNGKIYYTLDSSEPDENAIPYTGPIHITDASLNENVYCNNTDVAVDFYHDLLTEAGVITRFNYKVPDAPIDKATVVRAVSIDEEGNPGKVVNGVYFIGFEEKTGYDDVFIVSVTTNPDNLFDFENGIYVTGRAFQDLLVDGKLQVKSDQDINTLSANYHKHGLDWEREAHAVVFNEKREIVLEGDYGLRIQGNSSRGRLPKGLNLFAREQYGEESFPTAGIFGRDEILTSINFQSLTQGMDTKMNDYLANVLTGDLAFATREFVPCQLFLEGEYWGVYWIVPRYEKRFFQNRYNVRADTVVRIKLSPQDVDSEDDLKLYREMEEYICEHDMSDPEQFAKACEMIDLQSCVDYYATEIYIVNEDWPVQNTALWRVRKPEPGPYADGRWRWTMFDVNWSMKPHNWDRDYIQDIVARDPLFESLIRSETFSSMLRQRLVALAEDNFNPDRVAGLIADYEQLIAEPMLKEYERFYGGGKTIDTFMDGCDAIYEFFEKRCEYILGTYGDENEQAG